MPVPYDEPGNVVWQTQIDAEPSANARALADSLEGILGQGVHDIDGIVARLNDLGPSPEGAAQWTPSVFEAEMVRLGA